MRFQKIQIFILSLFLLTGGSARLWAGTATIDATTTDQIINGFGGCSAWHEAAFAANLATWFWDDTNTVVNGGVTSASGIGMSLLRCHIPYTNTVGSTGGTGIGDPGETAVMNQAIGLGVTQIWCTEWTPPTAYKSNGAADCTPCNAGGNGECTCTNNTFNNNNTGYAGYLVNYIQYVNSKLTGGVKVLAVSPQNEPDWNPSYESALWTAAQFDAFVPALYSALQTAGLSTKIMIPESFADNKALAQTAMDDATAAPEVGIIGDHLYGLGGGQPYSLAGAGFTDLTNQYNWETEMSDVSGAANDLTMKSGFQEAGWIQQCIVGASMNAFHHWWLQNTSDADNEGLIGEDNNSTKKLWVLGNWSRFVRPGYYRMGATTSPSAGVSLSAFKNNSTTAPATFVIVAINTNNAAASTTFNLNSLNTTSVTLWLTDANDNLTQETAVAVSGNSFTYSLPVSSVVSFVGATTGTVPTATPTATATFTRTSTPTATKTATPTSTPTASATPSATAIRTATPTPSATSTWSPTSTATITFTRTASPTATLVNTATSTGTPTRTATFTVTPMDTPTNTASSTSTATTTVTLTPVFSFTPTSTPTDTAVPTSTNTSTATSSPIATSTSTPTLVYTATDSMTPSATASRTPTFTSTSTGTASLTASPTQTPTATRTASSTATLTRTPTPTNTSTPSPTTTPSSTATFTLTATPTATVTPTRTSIPTATRTATALPTDTPTPVIAHGPVVYPDPWNGETPVYMEIYQPEASRVEIRIITVAFRQVRELDQSLPAGFSRVPLDLEGLANGLYYVLVQSSAGRQVTKVLILR